MGVGHGTPRYTWDDFDMTFPKIDLSALPDLDQMTGVFGSLAHPAQALQSDDTVIVIMVYVYDILLP